MSLNSSNTLDKYLHRAGAILNRCRGTGIPAFAGALMLAAGAAHANDNGSTPMTAGIVMTEMPNRERTSYIIGLVEGLAYARFRQDTIASGQKDETGYRCILKWFYDGGMARLDRIEANFSTLADYPPAVVINAMVTKECGEK